MKSLYISYMGLSEPLLHSQAIPYLIGLSEKGIDVYILSFEKEKFAIESEIDNIKKRLQEHNIKWYHLKYHKSPQVFAKSLDIMSGIFNSFRIILKEKIDIIHARAAICAFMGILPKVILRKKMLFDMRGFMAEEFVDGDLWPENCLRYKIVSFLENYCVKISEEVIVLTYKAKDILENRIFKGEKQDKISVIPTCVDIQRFRFLDKEINKNKNFIMTYIGSLGTWYMIDKMLDFLSALKKIYPSAVFKIYTHSDIENAQNIAAKKGLSGVVVFGKVPLKEIPSVLSSSDIGIYFIKPYKSKLASFPTKLGEYLASGLPVVVNSGVGDCDDMIKKEKVGIVVENFSANAYDENILKLAELLKEGECLRKRCRKVAEDYLSLEKGNKKYYELYRRISGTGK